MAITLNARKLFIIIFLGLIGLLIFAIIAFYNFAQDYDDAKGAFNINFDQVLLSTISRGLRAGGGIGDSMKPASDSDLNYLYSRYIFEFCFWVIFNVLFLPMVFAMIIDTFKQLRTERMALMREISGVCYVCGIKRSIIDDKYSII